MGFWGFGFGFGFEVGVGGSGSGSGLGFEGFRVLGFEFRVSSLGFHLVLVWGLGVGV